MVYFYSHFAAFSVLQRHFLQDFLKRREMLLREFEYEGHPFFANYNLI